MARTPLRRIALSSLVLGALGGLAGCGSSRAAPGPAAIDAAPDAPVALCATRSVADADHARLTAAARSLEAYAATHGAFPPGAAATTPALGCCAQNYLAGHCCAPQAVDWIVPAWQAVGLEVTQPSAAQYSYRAGADGLTATLTAASDPDCDGRADVATVACTIVDGVAHCAMQ